MKISVTKRSNGNGKLVKGRPIVQQVVATYPHGRVRTSSGDVWTTRPCTTGAADLEAVE